MGDTGDSMNNNTDRFGALVSTLCAIHCAVCAFLPAVFAALGLGFLLTHQAEWLLTLVAVVFGLGAMILAWRTHRSASVAILLSLGIVGLLAARGLEMAAPHDDHHEDSHHSDAGHGDEHSAEGHHEEDRPHEDDHEDDHGDEHGDEHEDGHAGDDGGMHTLGASVGVLAAIFLVFGHMLNIRTTRRSREDCCD